MIERPETVLHQHIEKLNQNKQMSKLNSIQKHLMLAGGSDLENFYLSKKSLNHC